MHPFNVCTYISRYLRLCFACEVGMLLAEHIHLQHTTQREAFEMVVKTQTESKKTKTNLSFVLLVIGIQWLICVCVTSATRTRYRHD